MLGLTKEMRSLGMIGLCNIASHPLGRSEMANKNTLKALTSLALTKNPVLRPKEEVRSTCAIVLHNLICGCATDMTEENKQTVTVDGSEYSLDDLSETAQSIVGHVIAIRQEVGEVRHRLVTLQAAELQLSSELSSALKDAPAEAEVVD